MRPRHLLVPPIRPIRALRLGLFLTRILPRILLMLLLARPALAGTGIYWNFINNTAQDLHLRAQPPDGFDCWDSSQFPDDVLVPAYRPALVYLERTGCVDSDFTVGIVGGDYDGSLVRLWTVEQLSTHVPLRRNVHVAHSAKKFRYVADMAIGSSHSAITTQIEFTGAGSYDTVSAWVDFAPGSSPLPTGSYRDSCAGEYDAASGDLKVDCLDAIGSVRYDAILGYASVCEPGSPVSNDQGQPVCDRPSPSLPRGSYLDSCQPMHFDAIDGRLEALCAGPWGVAHLQTLETFYACAIDGTVSNRDGHLVCDQPFLPEGSYRSACPSPRYEGGVLHADCRTLVALPDRRLDYQALCAPRSTVHLDPVTNQLACDTPRQRATPAPAAPPVPPSRGPS